MVCKLPSARSLSKARSEGALRENMANADMSASVKEMSPSSQRESGMVAKPLRTKRKSASAERCVRALGATMDMGPPITRTSHRSSQGVFSHRCLRKASAANTVITRLEGSTGIAGVFAGDASCHGEGRRHASASFDARQSVKKCVKVLGNGCNEPMTE